MDIVRKTHQIADNHSGMILRTSYVQTTPIDTMMVEGMRCASGPSFFVFLERVIIS